MTDLIAKQLTIVWIMLYCGLTAGLVNHVVFLFRSRFIRSRFLNGLVQVLGFVLIGWCIGQFLYYSSYGKITFLSVARFFAGLWIWKKIFEGTEDGEAQWRKKETDCAPLKKTTGHWIFPVRRRSGKKSESQEKGRK